MMKTSVCRRLLALLSLALLLASCGRLAAPQDEGAATGRLTIVVEDGRTGLSRSIAPGQPTVADLGDAGQYQLRLTGTTGRQDLPERTVTLAAGRATLDNIPDGLWHLTLTAYNAAGITPLLSGHSTVEVRSGQERVEARFTLTPVAGGTGTISLTVSWQEADRFFVQPATGSYPSGLTVSMALYDPATGQKATSYERRADGSNGTPSDTDAFFRRGFTGGSGGSTAPLATTFTYTGGTSGGKTYNVPAGMYRLKFMVTGGNLPPGTSLEWRDTLYVEPGRETNGTVTIPQLSHIPAAPQNFSGTASAPTATPNGRYTGSLTWATVYNASAYELELLSYTTGTVLPTDDATWTAAAAAAGSAVYRYNAVPGDAGNYNNQAAPRPVVTAGNLLGASSAMSLSLAVATGQSYTARIRAANALGSSGWVYLASPLVPGPVAPASLSAVTSSINIAAGTTTFPATVSWGGGYVDAGGTWELQVLAFTGGNMPSTEANWNAAAGRAEYTLTATAPTNGPAAVTGGSLAPASTTATLALNDSAVYYTARIRGRNSGGATSGWTYLSAPMIPMPAIVGHNSTQATRWTYSGSVRVQVWDTDLTIWGPQSGTDMRMEWIKLQVKAQDGQVVDDDSWAYLYGLTLNSGSNGKVVSIRGSGTNRMTDMNKDMPFLFRIRLNTPYGSSPWFYYRDNVRQAP